MSNKVSIGDLPWRNRHSKAEKRDHTITCATFLFKSQMDTTNIHSRASETGLVLKWGVVKSYLNF